MPGNLPDTRIFDVAKVYGNIEKIKSARMQNRLAEMQLQEYEKGIAKKTERDLLAQQYITPGQPAMQQAPQYDMGGAPPDLVGYQYGQAPYQEAVPASFDRPGYRGALLGAGDIEGYKQIEAEKMAELKTELEIVAKEYAINPKAGARRWNEGLLGKEEGKIEHLGVKDGWQININQTTGEVLGVNKKNFEVKVFREGKPKVEKLEYKPGQALSKLSSIDKALVGLKTGGSTVDEALVKQFPILAAYSSPEGDPEAIIAAIETLEREREYVEQFAPRKKKGRKLTKEEAMSYLQEAGGDKEKARALAKADGRTF